MRWLILCGALACGASQSTPTGATSTEDSVAQSNEPEPMTRQRACRQTAELHRFSVPSYALLHGSYAHVSGTRLAITYVGSGHHQIRVPVGQPAGFQGAIHDVATGAWSDIPQPPASVLPRGPSSRVHWVSAGDRIAMLVYSSIRGSGARAVVLDLASNRWREVTGQGPPGEAFLTGPYRAGSTDRFWVWWPSHEGGANYAAGYALDLAEARWVRTSPEGAPTVRGFSRPQRLPDGRLVVIPVRSELGGIFDPLRNRWESFDVPASVAGYETVAVSEGGRDAAVLHFEESGPQQRRIQGYIVDLRTQRVETLPVPNVTLDWHPNSQMLHVDAARIVYVNARSMHVFDRRMRRWSESELPFDAPVTNTGAFIELCGGRVLAEHREWLLDLGAMQWRRLIWPADVRRRASHTLYDDERMWLVGEVRNVTEETNCPPGAPCMAPETERIEVLESFAVPLIGER